MEVDHLAAAAAYSDCIPHMSLKFFARQSRGFASAPSNTLPNDSHLVAGLLSRTNPQWTGLQIIMQAVSFCTDNLRQSINVRVCNITLK